MDILVFGIQGAGKGTQAKAVSLALGLPIYEAGAELRRLAAENTPLGEEIRKVIYTGRLVPPGMVLLRIAEYLEHPATVAGVIYDGVPRSYEQAIAFDEMMKEKKRDSLAIDIELSEGKALERLEKRRICSKCQAIFMPDYESEVCNICGGVLIHRADDNSEAIKVRFANYHKETVPVIDYFRKQGKLLTIDGDQSILDVTKDIFNQLSPLLKLKKRLKDEEIRALHNMK